MGVARRRAATGRELGLADADRPVRVRALDPALAAGISGLVDVAAPQKKLGSLDWAPRIVLNLEYRE